MKNFGEFLSSLKETFQSVYELGTNIRRVIKDDPSTTDYSTDVRIKHLDQGLDNAVSKMNAQDANQAYQNSMRPKGPARTALFVASLVSRSTDPA